MQSEQQAPQEKQFSLIFTESQVNQLLFLLGKLAHNDVAPWIDGILKACQTQEAQVPQKPLIHSV